jgi:hypothetical protein
MESAVLVIQCGEIDPKWSYFEEKYKFEFAIFGLKGPAHHQTKAEIFFFLFSSLTCGQIIWLNVLVYDRHTLTSQN